MSNSGTEPEHLIFGVPARQLERFLVLIRDGYPKTQLATCFLEQRAGITNVSGMANVRDALSHLATFLDPTLDPQKRAEQVSSAEEHLRRAIIEPYQIAVDDLVVKIDDLYGKYKQRLLPVKDRHTSLHGAPNQVQIDARLREIHDLASNGRVAKGRNRWDEEWENGVRDLTTAFDRLKELHSDLEGYWHRFEQVKSDGRDRRFHKQDIVLSIVMLLLGILVDFFAHRLHWW